MTYKELKAKVAEMVKKGEKLHGYALEIAIEMALEEKEK